MEKIIRRWCRHAACLTVATAAVGWTAPGWAQAPSAWNGLPPGTSAAPATSGWPDYPTAAPAKPADGPTLAPVTEPTPLPTRPAVLPPPPSNSQVWMVTPSNQILPKAQPPGNPPSNTGAPFWRAGDATPGAIQPTSGVQRDPREFGNGWKSFVNQRVLGITPPHTSAMPMSSSPPMPSSASMLPGGMMGRPVASLSQPQGSVMGPARPDWGWHGYGQYNAHSRSAAQAAMQISGGTFTQEMAPYMKYAHLWRPSNNPGFSANVAAGPAAPGLMPSNAMPTQDGVSISSTAPAAPTPTGTVPVQWRGLEGDMGLEPVTHATPKPTAPANGWGQRPVQEQPISRRAAAPEPPSMTSNRLPLAARQRISEIAGVRARNLVVEQLSPIRLRIAFQVPSQTDAEELSSQLAALPELGPYKVDFEVQIAP